MKIRTIISQGIHQCQQIAHAFQMEYVETKAMVATFNSLMRQQFLQEKDIIVSEQEIEEAYAQLWDLPKFLPFFIIAFLPIPGIIEIYLVFAFSLEKAFGAKINLLPSQLKKVLQENRN